MWSTIQEENIAWCDLWIRFQNAETIKPPNKNIDNDMTWLLNS